MSTDMDQFFDQGDDVCLGTVAIARGGPGVNAEAMVSLIATSDPLMEGPTLVANGTVSHDQKAVAISIRGFIDKASTEVEVIMLGDQVIVSLKNG